MKNILIIEHRDEVSSNGGGGHVAGRLWFCFSVKSENRSEGGRVGTMGGGEIFKKFRGYKIKGPVSE